MIWKPTSGSATINLSAIASARVRARFFDPVNGTYTTVAGSPFLNSGTQVFTWPGERVLVLDAG
jgi:hypothetical protein